MKTKIKSHKRKTRRGYRRVKSHYRAIPTSFKPAGRGGMIVEHRIFKTPLAEEERELLEIAKEQGDIQAIKSLTRQIKAKESIFPTEQEITEPKISPEDYSRERYLKEREQKARIRTLARQQRIGRL